MLADLEAVVAIQLAARAPLVEIGRVEILGLPPIAKPLFARTLLEDGVVIGVADGHDVGFGMFERLPDGVAHLHQLSVLPKAGRRGFGAQILDHLVAHATALGCSAMTLITYADVPWNRPFYERRGFVVLDADALPNHIEAHLREEWLAGIDLSQRVAMARRLATQTRSEGPR